MGRTLGVAGVEFLVVTGLCCSLEATAAIFGVGPSSF